MAFEHGRGVMGERTISISITSDLPAWAKRGLAPAFESEFEDMMYQMGADAMQFLMERSPVKSGHFVHSWKSTDMERTMADDWSIHIWNDADYAEALEFGQQPHAIIATRARALKWISETGEIVFRKAVWHPGTEGIHILDEAEKWFGTNYWRWVQEAYDRALEEAEKGGGTYSGGKYFD